MKKCIFEVALLIGLCISLLVGALAKEEQENISEKLIRLHIIANSDSETDQNLKLRVRDEILVYMESLTKNCPDKVSAQNLVKEHLDEFEEIANRICRKYGAEYEAVAELSKTGFPTKNYGDFSLPSGKYDALKIKLGKASGQNWWCVLFPPLCVSAAEAEDILEESGLTRSEISFVTEEKIEYRFKFKLLELIEKIAS